MIVTDCLQSCGSTSALCLLRCSEWLAEVVVALCGYCLLTTPQAERHDPLIYVPPVVFLVLWICTEVICTSRTEERTFLSLWFSTQAFTNILNWCLITVWLCVPKHVWLISQTRRRCWIVEAEAILHTTTPGASDRHLPNYLTFVSHIVM